ncbi:hypothetical protein [Luteitalea sp.]
MSRFITSALLAVFACVFVPQGLLAHPDHAKKVLGSVASITADQLTVKNVKGVETSIVLTRDTKVVRAKQAATMKDVTAGARVVVTADIVKDQLVARTIDITPAPAK